MFRLSRAQCAGAQAAFAACKAVTHPAVSGHGREIFPVWILAVQPDAGPSATPYVERHVWGTFKHVV